jgi:kumamolisin
MPKEHRRRVPMKIHNSIASLLAAAALFACCTSTALAQSARPGGGTSVTIPSSSIARTGDAGVQAHTNIRFTAISKDLKGVRPDFFGPPYPGYYYEDPASIACNYRLEKTVSGCNPNVASKNPNGGAKAIAVVDAFDDPNAYSDLASFVAQFGVGAISPSTFQVVYAPYGGATPGSCTGSATQPVTDPSGGWEVEESLDIEYAHSMAPEATLYLVEAQSNYFSDLLCAVSVASNLVQLAGGGEVSMSWGSGEFSGETTLDSVFTTPTVVYFASAGDSPGVSWPSASPNVVSVGGTSISRNPATGNFEREDGWQEGGSGPSYYESTPSYQSGITGIVGTQRGTPDVAADANPYTGVWVLDNFQGTYCSPTCWYIVGGTSVSSPLWAGIVNAAGTFSASTNAELTTLYGDPQTTDFFDITLGSCGPYIGYFAKTGWDFCTGLGSPKTYKGK